MRNLVPIRNPRSVMVKNELSMLVCKSVLQITRVTQQCFSSFAHVSFVFGFSWAFRPGLGRIWGAGWVLDGEFRPLRQLWLCGRVRTGSAFVGGRRRDAR